MHKNLGKQMLQASNENNIKMKNLAKNDIPMIEEELKIIKERIAQGDLSQKTADALKEKEAQLRSKQAMAYDRD